MPADLSALMSAAEGALLGLWRATGAGGGPPGVAGEPLLAFQPIGLPQPPSLFVPDNDPGGPPRPVLARERLARLVDDVRRVAAGPTGDDAQDDGAQVETTGRRVSTLYTECAENARPDPAWSADAVAAFERAKRQARDALAAATRASSLIPFDSYLDTRARPDRWYDPDAPDIWAKLNFWVGSPEPPAPPPPPGPGPGLGPGVGRPMRLDVPVERHTAAAVRAAPARQWRFRVAPSEPAAVELAPRPALALAARELVRAEAAPPAPPADAPATPLAREAVRTFNPAIARVVAAAATVAGPADVSLRFSACAVALERPWLDWDFLERPGWHLPGEPAGGTAPARWPALCVGMIVAKDVEVRVSRAPDDELVRAVSFGPFCLLGGVRAREMDDPARRTWAVVLRAAGVQVIGWVVQPLHALPPAPAPA